MAMAVAGILRHGAAFMGCGCCMAYKQLPVGKVMNPSPVGKRKDGMARC